MRRDRVPTIAVQATIGTGETLAAMHARVRGAIEAIELPIGYGFARQLPVAFLVVVPTSIVPFRRLRQPPSVWLLVQPRSGGSNF